MNISLPKALKYIVVCAAVLAAWSTFDHYRPKPVEPMTAQRRAAHRIEYTKGYCSGTTIGPHAILTATHCNKDRKDDTIKFDQSMQDYHIEKTLTDGRDHDVYLVDATFTTFVPYEVRPATVGEHVHLYGSVHAVYPPRRLDGVRMDYDDPSDIDNAAGVAQFSLPVNHGDSGSAVFNDDGTIAAVTTYLHEDDWMGGLLSDDTAIDFVPAFTPEQIKEAVDFEPVPYVAPTPEDPASPVNPFSFLFHK